MNRIGRQRVLITGASAGIGQVTAIHLARRGYHVVATSRELARLEELSTLARNESLSLSAFQLDVNDPVSVIEVVPEIIEAVGGLDALVNNAGYGLRGCLEDLTIDEVKAQFETNLFAVLRMCQAVLPHMRERQWGTIVNVGSVAGHIGIPGGGAYSASKFALAGLSKVLRIEVAQFGVRVVLVEPGLFRTSFIENQIVGQRVLDPQSPLHGYSQRTSRRTGMNEARRRRWAGNPIKVAKTIGRLLEAKHPGPSYTVGADAMLGVLAVRLLPGRLVEYLVKRVVER